MPTVTVEANVELDAFTTHELVEEIKMRWKNMNKYERQAISKVFATEVSSGIVPKCLDDQMKIEHIAEVFNKYTLAHIQSVLP